MTVLEALKDSPGYWELVEGMKEIERRHGVADGLRRAICELAAARLGGPPAGLEERVQALGIEELEVLFKAMAAAGDEEALREVVG
jgi:hypothetical protein